ncbi:hypothetical protein, partial [Alistipes sp.]|uniref:hypothetical protein n=1 Tax=Alistipes sp. TaxID=1872444 RepID=UPI003AAB186E
ITIRNIIFVLPAKSLNRKYFIFFIYRPRSPQQSHLRRRERIKFPVTIRRLRIPNGRRAAAQPHARQHPKRTENGRTPPGTNRPGKTDLHNKPGAGSDGIDEKRTRPKKTGSEP